MKTSKRYSTLNSRQSKPVRSSSKSSKYFLAKFPASSLPTTSRLCMPALIVRTRTPRMDPKTTPTPAGVITSLLLVLSPSTLLCFRGRQLVRLTWPAALSQLLSKHAVLPFKSTPSAGFDRHHTSVTFISSALSRSCGSYLRLLRSQR